MKSLNPDLFSGTDWNWISLEKKKLDPDERKLDPHHCSKLILFSPKLKIVIGRHADPNMSYLKFESLYSKQN